MSQIQQHFLGGQQQLKPEFLAMFSPTVNSYTRLIPGFWAPTDATWGVENRTTALRVIPGNDKSQRIEYRLGSADANPYLALAAALGAKLPTIGRTTAIILSGGNVDIPMYAECLAAE